MPPGIKKKIRIAYVERAYLESNLIKRREDYSSLTKTGAVFIDLTAAYDIECHRGVTN